MECMRREEHETDIVLCRIEFNQKFSQVDHKDGCVDPIMSSAGGKIRAKNTRNAEAARQGKTKPRPSYRERQELDKKPAIPAWVVYGIVFLLGGGLILELLRLFVK